MVHTSSRTGRRVAFATFAFTLVMATVGLTSPATASHEQQVVSVTGSAYGYYASVSLFGGPPSTKGPTPTVALAPDASNSPQTATAASGRFDAGPAVIFSSGQIDVTTEGAIGAGGSVTSSTNIRNVNASGQEVFTAANLTSTCTAASDTTPAGLPTTGASGSTMITGGTLQLDSGDDDPTNSIPDHPPVVVDLPVDPAPGTTYDGHIHIGNLTDSFRYVFNEQTVNPDGSITVNAAHQYLLGPLAVGELILGQSVCGVTSEPVEHLAPVAVDDAYTTAQDTALVVPAPGVLGNDTDAEGDTLAASNATDPANGSVVLNGDGSFTYTPDAGFFGTDSFDYTVTDDGGPGGDTGTVTITVTESAPPPPPPPPPCSPPSGLLSGPLFSLGSSLGGLGAGLVNLARSLCAAGL